MLAGAWLSTHWLLRESAIWRDRNTEEVRAAQRDSEYAYRLAVDPPAAKELRLFGIAGWVIERFVARRARLHDLQYEATRLREKPVVWSLLLVAAANAVVFWSIADSAVNGRLDLGAAVIFVQCALGTAMIAFGGLNWALDWAASPVAAVLRLEPAMSAAGALTTGARRAGGMPRSSIRFRAVTFAYPGGAAPVLQEFDLTIPAGSSLAIVGRNGAGKTTLAKLLCRLYDPQSGTIEVDGVDIRNLDLESWRSRIAAVFQDFIRFELPMRDNVAPQGAPDEHVLAALERGVWEGRAFANRLARHLFTTATTAAPGKEVRVTGIGSRLFRTAVRLGNGGTPALSKARWDSAVWHALAWAVFGSAYVAAVVFVSIGLRRPAGDVLLALAAGARLTAYIGGAAGEIGFLRSIWMDGAKRLAWLEDYVASLTASADLPVPARLHESIRFENVGFAYPGTDRRVLDGVSLTLPAGAVVAIVGENGAGKTTLIKLLGKFYEPTSGAILVDGQPLARIPAGAWRERLAGAFQDFFRFEFRALHSIGVGDVPRLDDTPAVTAAVGRAGAADVMSRFAAGLETQIGPTWPGGVEVSFGQWQKIALARAFMRDDPLVVVLDEPTAALDAETEHALFERYAAAAREGGGRITILVSHRFSTVRMADLIVVLDGARVVEIGSHDELIAKRGPYSELYGIQAAAYR